MKTETFNEIYINVILPGAKSISSGLTTLVFNEICKEKIYEKYEEARDDILRIMPSESRIDRHKVAACIGYAIICTKPFEIDDHDEMEFREVFANELLAVYSSLSVLKSFILSAAEENLDDSVNKKLIEIFNDKFIFPKPKHEDYVEYLVKNIYHSRKSQCFDTLTFSNLLYMIEEYTIKSYECDCNIK